MCYVGSPRIHELIIVWCWLDHYTNLQIESSFLIPYFYFLIDYFFSATKTQRHKVTRRLFLISVDNLIGSPLPSGEGLGVRFLIHEIVMISFPKSNFYILHSIFYILHFFCHEGCFISEMKTSPFGGSRGLPTPPTSQSPSPNPQSSSLPTRLSKMKCMNFYQSQYVLEMSSRHKSVSLLEH